MSHRDNEEELYESSVNAEMMIDCAFGSSSRPAKSLLDVSVVNKTTYLCALVNRCVLCGDTMLRDCRAAMEDTEECIIPNYVYAHRSCIRKNLVMLTDGANSIQRGAEPRDLHRELSAVSQFNPRSVVINKDSVVDALSLWYKTAYMSRRSFRPQLVWLRNHPMVRPEDTLYGALKITNDEVNQSVLASNEQSREVSVQAEARKKTVTSRIEMHKQQCVAELRVWLGKGHTRWRTVEDLEDFDKNIMTSIGFLAPTHTPPLTRVACGNMNVVFNTLLLLHKTIELMDRRARYCLTWLVNTIRVEMAFENATTSFNPSVMSFLPSETRQSVVEHEVKTTAAIVNSFAACKSEDLSVTRFAKADTVRVDQDLPNYNAHVSILLKDHNVTFTSHVFISHADMCKLKYVLIGLIANPDISRCIPSIPPVPDTDVSTVENFFSVMMKCCFSEGSGPALSKGLEVLVNQTTFSEVRDSFQEPEELQIING